MKLNIKHKLILSFVLVILVFVASIGFSINKMYALNTIVTSMGSNNIPSIVSAVKLQQTINKIKVAQLQYSLSNDSDKMLENQKLIEDLNDSVKQNVYEFLTSSADEQDKAIMHQFNNYWVEFQEKNKELLSVTGDSQKEKIYEINALISNIIINIENTLDKMVNKSIKNSQDGIDDSKDIYRKNRLLMFILLTASLGFSAAVSIYIIKLINKPLYNALKVVNKIADGDLKVDIKIDHNDEFGMLLHQLDITVKRLGSMIKIIKETSLNVSKATTEITLGNENLSHRTKKQAAFLEETSLVTKNLASKVRLNAEYSNKAHNLSKEGVQIVVAGNEILLKTIQSMQEVSQSSKKISDIISVVNEIAFQTNLLALNAAVEAARAGEHGKGFAVVAAEVRSLSQRTSTAAKEIQCLISDSSEKVRNGNSLVAETGEILEKITKSVKEIAEIISHIYEASQQQAQGVEEVNSAIAELNQITQQNSLLVEEATSSGELMNNEAENLIKLISEFNIDDDKTK